MIDVASGQSQRWRYSDMDERLYAHLGGRLAWHPEAELLAARITFAGGRFVIPGEPATPMFGDREVFIIDLKVAPHTLGKLFYFNYVLLL